MSCNEAAKRLEDLYEVRPGDTVRLGIDYGGARHVAALEKGQKLISRVSQIEQALATATKIEFDIVWMVNDPQFYDDITAREMRAVVSNPELASKATFVLGKAEIPISAIERLFSNLLRR